MKQIRMPSWAQYRTWPDEDRESLYQRWCQLQKLDPNHDDTGSAFIDSMPDSDMTDQTDREDLLDLDGE
jgi:hypothetical protein